MKLIVLGTGCSKCKTLHTNLLQAVNEMGITAEVSKVEDIQEILQYEVFALPALVRDGQVIATGLLSKQEIIHLLKQTS